MVVGVPARQCVCKCACTCSFLFVYLRVCMCVLSFCASTRVHVHVRVTNASLCVYTSARLHACPCEACVCVHAHVSACPCMCEYVRVGLRVQVHICAPVSVCARAHRACMCSHAQVLIWKQVTRAHAHQACHTCGSVCVWSASGCGETYSSTRWLCMLLQHVIGRKSSWCSLDDRLLLPACLALSDMFHCRHLAGYSTGLWQQAQLGL